MRREEGSGRATAAAHFCGSRWFRDRNGAASEIDFWEKTWPGPGFAPSCLVLPKRKSQFLPPKTMTGSDSTSRMVASPWDRVPVVFSSPEVEQALRAGPDAAAQAFKAALLSTLPGL